MAALQRPTVDWKRKLGDLGPHTTLVCQVEIIPVTAAKDELTRKFLWGEPSGKCRQLRAFLYFHVKPLGLTAFAFMKQSLTG